MRTLPLFGVVLLTAGLSARERAAVPALPPAVTVAAVDGAAQSEWRSLFDGRTLTGWRGYQMFRPPVGWSAEGGVLTKTSPTEDLISEGVYGDFELELEWKLGGGGNAGIFYRGTEEYEHVYWSAPEFQLLDDASAPDAKDRLTAAGAAYGLYPAPAGVVRPAGQWNTARIVCRGGHVEHWMNGQKVVTYELWSPDWEAKVKASKFGEWPNYGRARVGHIAFQGDHDGDLAFRNIRIRDLR
ncbi:MAG: hypothetical protein MNPFHGCM_00020 [Gemmatimonadaceae bacterium]|nr:hypothetical protein [Gemmatimonadaceae bacterium]